MDINSLFEDSKFVFGKNGISRNISFDDPSHPFHGFVSLSSYTPDTDNYAPSGVVKTDASSSIDYKEDLALRAQEALEEALEHSNRDVVIKNTLEMLLEAYEDKLDGYHKEHRVPGTKEEFLSEPAWASLPDLSSRLKTSGRSPIHRVGHSPSPEESLILQDIKLKLAALSDGMSAEEISAADSVIDSLFGGGGFRRRF